MDWHSLDGMIGALEQMIYERRSIIPARGSTYHFAPTELVGFTRNDWRPVWAQAKEIQTAFTAKTRYPTVIERERAWVRFNDLRNQASEYSRGEHEKFLYMSRHYRDEIVKLTRSAEYHWGVDVLFVFAPTTVEEMREKASTLKAAGQLLSKYKDKMLKEHKDECFSVIIEVRSTHDTFWDRYKTTLSDRHRHYEERRVATSARRSDAIARIQANLDANRERLSKTQDAVSRNENHIADLHDKISSARSAEWRERFMEWLSQAEEKRSSLRESERRLEEWIAQDNARLNDIYGKDRR